MEAPLAHLHGLPEPQPSPTVLYTQPSRSRLQPSVCVPGAACAPGLLPSHPFHRAASLLSGAMPPLKGWQLCTRWGEGRGAWGPMKVSAATIHAHPAS